MAKKLKHGNDIYSLLVDIIFSLTPLQAESLYTELLARYTKRAKTKLYNEKGEEDSKGKIRLTALQYKTLRTKFGDTYVRKSFTELTNYINYLEKNMDSIPNAKSKLNKLNSGTHNALLSTDNGWVYNKCKSFICTERPKLNINPYLIDDIGTAREYIKSIPKELRENAYDVKSLLLKFPELVALDEQDDG